MTDAFYLSRGVGRFLPTKHTAGPWTPDAQHFGPPSALLMRELEKISAERPSFFARVTIEILGPTPLTELSIRSKVERSGRSVELLSAELISGERAVAKASAWRIATSDTSSVATKDTVLTPTPDECPPAAWPREWHGGYLEAMDWRQASGSPDVPGAAAIWGKQRFPLVDDEIPSPLQRLLIIADCGNGISSALEPQDWWFINSELTVHTHRMPEGEWMGISAATLVGPQGTGTATSTLYDTTGQVAIGAQALLIRRR